MNFLIIWEEVSKPCQLLEEMNWNADHEKGMSA